MGRERPVIDPVRPLPVEPPVFFEDGLGGVGQPVVGPLAPPPGSLLVAGPLAGLGDVTADDRPCPGAR